MVEREVAKVDTPCDDGGWGHAAATSKGTDEDDTNDDEGIHIAIVSGRL